MILIQSQGPASTTGLIVDYNLAWIAIGLLGIGLILWGLIYMWGRRGGGRE